MKEHYEKVASEIRDQLANYIPHHMHDSIMSWLWDAYIPGGFLLAILENDLSKASVLADVMNSASLANYGKFFSWFMPSTCWGSREIVFAWSQIGGWNGMLKSDSETGGTK